MKELFIIEDSLSNKISYYHLLLLLITLPFDFFYSHVILISFAFHTLINAKAQNLRALLGVKPLLLQSVFFVTLIGMLYSSYQNQALQDLIRQASIFLFPLLFCLTNLNLAKYRSRLLLAFSVCCTITVVYLYADALHIIRYFKYPFSTLFSKSFINHNFSAPIAMHATFFSLQLGVALVYLLSALLKERIWLNRAIYIFCCAILSAAIIQLCSKAVFVALFLAVNIAVPFFLLRGKKRLRFVLITGSLSLLLVFTVFKADAFKDRYFTDLKVDLKETSSDTDDPRIERWQAAGELIAHRPITGYGSGSELEILHNQFFAKKLYNSFLGNLNAHNQYISFLLVSGIFGLLIYLANLIFGFRMAWQQGDAVFFGLMMLVSIVSISESILNAEKGIFFYALFLSFFAFSGNTKSTLNALKTK